MSSSVFAYLHLAGYRDLLRDGDGGGGDGGGGDGGGGDGDGGGGDGDGGGGDGGACVNEVLKSAVESARAGTGAG